VAINDAPHIMTAKRTLKYGTNFDFDINLTFVQNVGNVGDVSLLFFDFNCCLMYTDSADEITEERSKELARYYKMKGSKIQPQIFISYAREDADAAEQLYQFLSGAGYKPWMDTKDILPGERWLESIQDAIERSDFFLACLSENSVDKRGILQKEIKSALDAWEGMLEGDIYLIPVRLEPCDVPNRLSGFQWVDLFEDGGWVKLKEAILEGTRRREGKNTSAGKLLSNSTPRDHNLYKGGIVGRFLRYRFLIWAVLTLLSILFIPVIYNNIIYRVPRPELPTAFCQVSPTPLEVGVAEFPKCTGDFSENLVKNWDSEKVNITFLPEHFDSSVDARIQGSNFDIVLWGECSEQDMKIVSLNYEIITSIKPFESYEPTTLVANGNIIDMSIVSLAIVNYRLGDFSEAHQLLISTTITQTLADLMLIMANSSLFDSQSITAISEYKEITRAFPSDSAAAYNNMGVAISSEDRNQALGWINQAIVLAEDNFQKDIEITARVNRSQMYLLEKKWEEAKTDCDRAILINADLPSPYICLAKYNFSYSRFGVPWLPFPFNEINRNLNRAEEYQDIPAIVFYLRADWLNSHFWKDKQAIVAAYSRYLTEMEFRACLPTDQDRNAYALGFLDKLTVTPK